MHDIEDLQLIISVTT